MWDSRRHFLATRCGAIEELTQTGGLPCIRLGRSVRYRPEGLRQWAAWQKGGAA